jgi:hypothetical protein
LSATRLDDKKDLIALHPECESDWLSKLVDLHLPYLRMFCLVCIPIPSKTFLSFSVHDSHVDESIALFSMRKVNGAVEILSMIIAAVLKIVPIVTLNAVTYNNVRLGLICVFAILFAFNIHISTNARKAELFASTVA